MLNCNSAKILIGSLQTQCTPQQHARCQVTRRQVRKCADLFNIQGEAASALMHSSSNLVCDVVPVQSHAHVLLHLFNTEGLQQHVLVAGQALYGL